MRCNRIRKSIMLFLILTTISLIGCAPIQRPLPDQPGIPNTNPDINNIDNVPNMRNSDTANNPGITRLGNDTGINDSRTDVGIPNTMGMDNENVRSQNIVRQLEARADIERASCVISDNTALVAVDVKGNTDGSSKNIKDDVTSMVKNMEPGVTNVAVTESPDLFERVNNLSRDMENGRTMQGLGEEFNKLVNRIIPAAR